MRLPPPSLPPWLDRLVPFDRYFIRVGGMKLHVMEAGDPLGLPVVLLHGNPTWGFLYRNIAPAVGAAGLRVIMPDLVGLGYSDKPASGFHTLDRHGLVMAELFELLALDRAIFVGQDWGGPIGLRAFAERPKTLVGLVVLNTVVGPPKPGFKPTGFHRFSALPLLPTVAFRLLGFPQRGFLRMVQGDRGSIRGDVARAYLEPLRAFRSNAAPLALARMVPGSMQHPSVPALQRCEDLVRSFRGPSAIVWGDRDPILGRLRARTERLMPDAVVTRTSAGHFLQEEVPGQIAAAILDVASRLG